MPRFGITVFHKLPSGAISLGSFFMWQLGDGVAMAPALGLLGQLNLGRIRAFQGLFIASSPSAQGGIEITRQLVGNISRLFKGR